MRSLAKFAFIGGIIFAASCAHKAVVQPLQMKEGDFWEYRYAHCDVELAISRLMMPESKRVLRIKTSRQESLDVRIFGTKNDLIIEPAMFEARISSDWLRNLFQMTDKPILNTWLWVEVKSQNSKPCYFKVRFEESP